MGGVQKSCLLSDGGPQNADSCAPGRKSPDRGYWFPAAHARATYRTKQTLNQSLNIFSYFKWAVCWGQPAPARESPSQAPEFSRQDDPGSWLGLMEGNPSPSWFAIGTTSRPALAKLLLAQSQCVQCFKRPKLKTSEFGVSVNLHFFKITFSILFLLGSNWPCSHLLFVPYPSAFAHTAQSLP